MPKQSVRSQHPTSRFALFMQAPLLNVLTFICRIVFVLATLSLMIGGGWWLKGIIRPHFGAYGQLFSFITFTLFTIAGLIVAIKGQARLLLWMVQRYARNIAEKKGGANDEAH